MKKQFLSFLLLISFAFSVFGQNKEAQLIDEIGRIPCGEFMARMNQLFITFENSPKSKIYVIYYDGSETKIWNKKLKTYETKQINPIRGTALNLAKAIPLYLEKVYKLSPDNVVLLDGGFRESRMDAIWIVPDGAELPKPTPTVDAKNIRFRKGKPSKTPDYAGCYDGYNE